jgi:hypothetical protein
MKVSVFSENGCLLWSREITEGQPSGFTSVNYLRDGTQHEIVAALSDALDEALGQLSSAPLEVVDAVADVGLAAAKVDRHVPLAIVRNRDAGR